MDMANEVTVSRYKREGAALWVNIPRIAEPRNNYPLPCINDVIDVREVTFLSGEPSKVEKPIGTCYVYGFTQELVLCRKWCMNDYSYDITFRKKEFLRGGLLYGPAGEERRERIMSAVSKLG